MEKKNFGGTGSLLFTNIKWLQNVIPLIGLAALILFFGILTGFESLGLSNLKLVFEQSFVLLICSAGVFFVMTMGSLDFSQGAIVGVASIAVIVFGHDSLLLGLLAGIVVGFLIGLLNGILHVYAKIGSFIVTICTMFIFRGVCAFLTTDTPFSAPIYMYMMNAWAFCIPIVIAILLIGWLISSKTKLGYQIRAIGAGETAAKFSGVNVRVVKILVFVLAGVLAGLAATLNVMRVGSITASAGTLIETNVMIALVLGGLPVSGGAKTNFLSVITGVFMLSVLNNGLVMLQIEPNIQQLIRGLVFLTIVAITTDRKSTRVIK